ncbi:hypothetical protein [Streptomyces xantholiticus]|uniref:hypothetical protein n=1 Tax=Streptomyces xantholiticus TaxID=68285 RepID=UPI0016723411|nr:hypothetical protein [Streptomyces xantholiticus]GGW70400.1 hypothetical protein GCM10010381_63880 [Streptomyces xantholiticus]
MNGPERKEDEVRRLMDGPHPVVPADLGPRAAAIGARLLRRHRIARRAWLLLLVAAVIACTVWATVTEPWAVPPSNTTPPLEGW